MPPIVQITSNRLIQVEQGAGYWIRFLARMIDAIYATIFIVVVYIFILALSELNILSPVWLEASKPDGFRNLVETLSIYGSMLVYYAMCETIGGATLGKMICGLRVVHESKRPCSFLAALLRNLLFFIDSIFFGLVGYSFMVRSPLRQRVGDMAARTVVVRASSLAPEFKYPTKRLILSTILGALFWVVYAVFYWALDPLFV